MKRRRSGGRHRLPQIPPVRAIVTDVDGTLTDSHRRLDPEAVRAVHAATRRGWPVILATGNVLPIALALYRSLGLTGPIVAENGGLLYEREGGRDTVTKLASRGVALRAFRRARRAGFAVEPLFTDRWRETEVAVEPTVSVRGLREAVRSLPVTVESTGYAVHFMERGHGKLPALHRALRRAGLSLADCMVAGDGDNDVAMLNEAGWAVSFPSASRAARAAADYVTKRRYSGGFVEALMLLGVYDPTVPPGRQ